MNVRVLSIAGLLSLLGSACALSSPVRFAGGTLHRSTLYSPGDGVVIVPVETSTDTVTLASFSIRVRHAELGYEVLYYVADRTFLLEPGRYLITSASAGRHTGGVTSNVFTVKSGEVTVLPTLRIFEEEGQVRARFDRETSAVEADFEPILRGTLWEKRPWRACSSERETFATAFMIPLPPQQRRSWWSSNQGSSSSWSPSNTYTPTRDTSHSKPSSTRTPR